MSLSNLDSQSGTGLSVASEATVATYTTAADGWVSGRLLLSNLNAAAATLTVKVQILDSSSNKLGVPVSFSATKDATLDTVAAFVWGPVRVTSGQKLRVRAASSNSSDTNASWASVMDDISAADLQTIKGQAVTAAAGVTFPTSIGTSTYAGGDTAGTGTLLTRLTATRAGYLDNLASAPPTSAAIATAVAAAILVTPANKIATDGSNRVSVDKTGYALSSAANEAVAAAVEAALLDEDDGQAVLDAIVSKINEVDADLSGLSVAAIASAVQTAIERVGGKLALVQAQTDKIPASPAAVGDIPTASANAAAVAAQITTDHGSGSYVRNTEPPTAAAVANQVDTTLSGTHGSGAWGSSSGGSGVNAIAVSTLYDASPLGAVATTLTTGATVYSQVTSGAGAATYNLAAGTYTLAAALSGYQFASAVGAGGVSVNGTTVTITGSGTLTVTLSAVTHSSAGDPSQSRCYLTCYDAQGNPAPTAAITLQQTAAGSTGAWPNNLLVLSCDEDGDIVDPVDGEKGVILARGVAYRAHRGDGAASADRKWVAFTPNADPYDMPAMIGQD